MSLKGKKVILVESHYLPIKIKRIMARIFFTYYQVRLADGNGNMI